MRKLLVASIACLVLGCGSKASDGSSSSKASSTSESTSSSSSTSTSRPKAAVGGGFVTPALGAPDAIEPPSREIVPGMLVADAKAKGAKPDTVDYTLKWRPDTDLWVNKDFDLISNMQVEYPAKDWEALKAKWGKPTIDDDTWVGANWMAKLNGCAGGPCGVTFTRSPMTWLEKTPIPPGPLANLKAGMSPEEVKKATGIPLKFTGGSDNGWGWYLSINPGDKFEDLSLDATAGKEADWLPKVTALWGAPTDLGDAKVWVNAKDGWLVQFGYAGSLLRFMPMKPIAGLLAKSGADSVIARAQSLLGKPKTALATTPGYDAKHETFDTLANEYSLSSPRIDVDTGDKDEISAVNLYLTVDNEADAEKVMKLVTSAWGPITKTKNENDEEVQTISVDGLKVKVEGDSHGTHLTLSK